MEDEYLSARTAKHYQAYRPPLHSAILARCLPKRDHGNGLDVGCGAGHSSRALLPYCREICAIDPSPIMLSMAGRHARIQYQQFAEAGLPVANESIGLITFAGSWFYAKSQQLLDDVLRVSASGATLLIYDFKISFDSLISMVSKPKPAVTYNHSENLAGFDHRSFVLQNKIIDEIYFEITPLELTHLILSEKDYFDALSGMYPDGDLTLILSALIEDKQGEVMSIPAQIYASKYILHI